MSVILILNGVWMCTKTSEDFEDFCIRQDLWTFSLKPFDSPETCGLSPLSPLIRQDLWTFSLKPFDSPRTCGLALFKRYDTPVAVRTSLSDLGGWTEAEQHFEDVLCRNRIFVIVSKRQQQSLFSGRIACEILETFRSSGTFDVNSGIFSRPSRVDRGEDRPKKRVDWLRGSQMCMSYPTRMR